MNVKWWYIGGCLLKVRNPVGSAIVYYKCGRLALTLDYAGCRPDDGYQNHSRYYGLELHFFFVGDV